MKYKEDFILINQAFECDSTFFEVFDAELQLAIMNTILNNPGSMVVSESFAKKPSEKQSGWSRSLTLPSGQFYAGDIDFTIKRHYEGFSSKQPFSPRIYYNTN